MPNNFSKYLPSCNTIWPYTTAMRNAVFYCDGRVITYGLYCFADCNIFSVQCETKNSAFRTILITVRDVLNPKFLTHQHEHTNLDSRCWCRSRWCCPDTRRSSLFDRRRVWSRYDTQQPPMCRIPSHQYLTHRSTVLATWHNISLKTRRHINSQLQQPTTWLSHRCSLTAGS